MIYQKVFKNVLLILNMYLKFKKAGVIHKIIQQRLREYLKLGVSALEIAEFIENQIDIFLPRDNEQPWKQGYGFPVGVNINEVAAHFSPSNINPIILDDDLVKIDFGVHIDGCISDGAFSWCPSGKYNELITIAENATNIGIKHSGVDAVLGDIGEYIEEFINSHEITIDNEVKKICSITDLSGHNITPYHIHGGKFVPNGKIRYNERMRENEIFAIETFPTTGNKHVFETSEVNHFMIEKEEFDNKELFKVFKTLPFCPRWVEADVDIQKINSVKKYPVIMNDGIVAQYEKSVFIKEFSVEVLN